MAVGLDGVFDVPDEGAEAEEGTVFIEFAKASEEGFYLAVFDHCEDCLGECGPGVGTVVGLAVGRASPLHGAEAREAAAVQARQRVDDGLVDGLVVCYEYRFHCL